MTLGAVGSWENELGKNFFSNFPTSAGGKKQKAKTGQGRCSVAD